MPFTPFNSWTFPDEFEDPFFTRFQNMTGQMDSTVHTVKVYERAIMDGGGTVTFASGGVMEWTEDFVVPIFSSGFKVNLEFGPDNLSQVAVLNNGDFIFGEVPIAISQNININMSVTNVVATKLDKVFVVGWRNNNKLLLRDGRTFSF